jgi:hypothetical protein
MSILNAPKGLYLMATNDKKTIQLRDDRLKICGTCEFAKAGFCKKCGCILAAKTRVKTEKCPENKW